MYNLSAFLKVFPTMSFKCTQARTIRRCTYSMHQCYYSNSLKHNQPLIDCHLNLLVENNFHKPTMEKVLRSNLEWSKISPTELKNTIEVLQSYKFSVNDITDVLETAPETCSIEKNVLIDTLETWLTCQFSFEKLIDLFSVQPILLKTNKKHISERIPTYLLIFNNNKNKLLIFLKLCPEIMSENFDDIIEKYNYVRHTMEITPKELLNSRVLCFDLNFIKTRHMFLDRSGQFQYKTKNSSNLQALGNPTLNSIFDTTDEIFAEKIAKMNLLEYETFFKYYSQELLEEDNSDSDEEP